MADNTTLDAGTGGDTIRTEDRTSFKTPVSLLDVGGTSGEALIGDSGNYLPVEGAAAENAAAAGNPILVGARYDATPRTLGDGDVGAIALDADGAVQISDGGNTITVDGTVTANLSATDNAVLDAIAASVAGTLTVDGSGVTQPVSGTVTANLSAVDNAVLDAIAASLAGTLTVDGSGVTQPVSGTVGVSGTVAVTDNSGSLTVDAANDGSLNVTIGDGSNTATIRNLAANDALNVSIVDGAGNQVTSFGGSGGTSATDDAAFTAGSGSGTPLMGFASSDTVDSGDVGVVAMQTNRSMNVHVTGNDVATGGTSSTDDAAFTAGSGSGTPAMGFFSTDTVNSGDVGVLAMDASRRLLVSIEADNAGIGGGTQYTEDAAAPANPVGNALMAERDDALGGLTPAAGDWTHLYCNANGALWVKQDGDITVSGTVTVDGSGVTQPVSGTVTANLSATDNAVLDSIDNAVTNLNAKDLQLINGDDKAISSGRVVSSVTYLFDGSTYDRAPGNSTDGMLVNLGSNNDVSVSGTVAVTDNGGSLTVDNADITTIAGAVSGSEMQVDLVASIPAGTNNIGDVDVASIAAGSNLIGDVGIQGRTTGGLSIYYDNDIDETAVAVKASAGTLYGIHAINTTAAPLYLQFFDVAQGSVTVGTTTPTMQMIVPGNADSDGAGFTFNVPQGIAFGTAITLACSTNSEGNSAPGANACHVNLFYK